MSSQCTGENCYSRDIDEYLSLRFCANFEKCYPNPKTSNRRMQSKPQAQAPQKEPELTLEQKIIQEKLIRPLVNKFFEKHTNPNSAVKDYGQWVKKLEPKYRRFVWEVVRTTADAGILHESEFKDFVEQFFEIDRVAREHARAETSRRILEGFRDAYMIKGKIDEKTRDHIKKVLKL